MEGKLVGDCHCHHRLVPSGYCDIAGHITSCSHCQKPEQPETDWEEEADNIQKTFERFGYESCPVCGITPKYLKDYIKKTLAKQKEEIIKKLEGMKTDIPDDGYKPAEITSLADMGAHRAYNQALSECIEAIKQM